MRGTPMKASWVTELTCPYHRDSPSSVKQSGAVRPLLCGDYSAAAIDVPLLRGGSTTSTPTSMDSGATPSFGGIG
ncbi:MAG: hypothetical protein ABSA26_00590 [Thermoguttaceae bacterium]